jgi:septal ring factor EnvC (AmiA/AmiB activator)
MLNRPSVTRRGGRTVIRGLVASLFAPIITASLFAQPPTAPGPSTELSRRATDRLQALHEEAENLAADERTVLGQLRQLELERQIRSEEVRQADADVTVVVDQIAVTDRQIAQFVTDRDTERPRLQARLVEIYKLGRGRYLRLLLSTADLRRLGHASRTVAALAMSDRERIARYERRLGELSAARQAQSSRQQRLAERRAAAVQAQAAAARAVGQRNAMVREIDQKRDLNAQLASELQAARQKLESTLKGVAAAGTPPALPIGPFRGALPWPVTGAIDRRGGLAAAADAGARPGIEIEAPEGSEVHAVHDGTVAYAGSFEGLGNLVILDHGAQTFSLYGYLLDMTVGRGAHVDRGQAIGRVGSPPTGSERLYFELRVEGHPVDSRQWLGSNGRH